VQNAIGFEPVCKNNNEIAYYFAAILNKFQYDLIIKTIATGLSFRQIMNVIKVFCDMADTGRKVEHINC
jgi:hypothetical protein